MNYSILLLALPLLVACGSVKKRPVTEQFNCGTYDSFVTNYVQPEDTTRSHISYCLCEKEGALKRSTDSITKRYLLNQIDAPDSLERMPVDELFVAAIGNYFSSDYVSSIAGDGGHMPPWYLDVNISYSMGSPEILTGTYTHSVYTGGAHPNGTELYHNFNVKTGKCLSLKDVCTNIPELERRAEKIFRETMGLETNSDLEESGFWFTGNRFHLNENFYISDGWMVFVFNQYEVAPYAMGVIYCEIPLGQIGDILKVDI